MNVIDVGSGPPVLMIPGVQGRWEWMRPAVDALARTCRVVTFSLADEPGARARFDEQHAFDSYIAEVCEALDQAGLERAAICGVSYGGLIAAAFAARHPDRVDSLILVSALPPGWQPDARARFYLRAPRLLSPLFCIGSLRMYGEIAAASDGVLSSVMAASAHGWNVVTHMFSPARMARRILMLRQADAARGLESVSCPTLIVTGAASLDRVVPVSATHQYARLWPHARVVSIPRTGHLGLITRPALFAATVGDFVRETSGGREPRRRIG